MTGSFGQGTLLPSLPGTQAIGTLRADLSWNRSRLPVLQLASRCRFARTCMCRQIPTDIRMYALEKPTLRSSLE